MDEIIRKITDDDIKEGKYILGLPDKFAGSTILSNPYLTDVCMKMNGNENNKPDSLNAISDWLKELDAKTGVKCYASVPTISDFKKSWFNPLRDRAIDGMLSEGFDVITIAGIEFKKDVLDRDGIIELRKKELSKSESKDIVKSEEESLDPIKELVDYLDYCKIRRDDDLRNTVQWAKEIRMTVDTILKHTKDTNKSPNLHLELFQQEVSIYIEANVKTIRELFGDSKEDEYIERFQENYKTIATIRRSQFASQDEVEVQA